MDTNKPKVIVTDVTYDLHDARQDPSDFLYDVAGPDRVDVVRVDIEPGHPILADEQRDAGCTMTFHAPRNGGPVVGYKGNGDGQPTGHSTTRFEHLIKVVSMMMSGLLRRRGYGTVYKARVGEQDVERVFALVA